MHDMELEESEVTLLISRTIFDELVKEATS